MSFVLVTQTLACGSAELQPSDSSDTEVLGTRSDPLYYLSTALWPQRDISVCWETTGQGAERAWVKAALRGQRSWSQTANVNFVGWQACSPQSTGIRVTGGTDAFTEFLGMDSSGVARMTLDFGASPQDTYGRCKNNRLSREECIKTVALHEFGHALGFAHEQNRDNDPASCAVATEAGTDGDRTFGNYDVGSIMAYCNFTSQLSGTDRRGTDRLYKQVNADDRRLSDFDYDQRDDLLCHDVTNGHKWTALANGTGQLAASWERASGWCHHDTARLFTGDFNGDMRADLLCHDLATGAQWIDFADALGQFNGSDWSRTSTWCREPKSRLFVGRFNADTHDDLLCLSAGGYKFIDYADAAGVFGGTDWILPDLWCTHSEARLLLGDFDGDGRDDLLCHDVATGNKWVRYATPVGRFDGASWSITTTWCSHPTAELLIGDFNRDLRDDLLCHDVANGDLWIDYADAAGAFNGTDWQRSAGFCAANADRLFVGDINGDQYDDLLCHDLGTGRKRIDYASDGGQFWGVDWTWETRWCSHTAAELH